MCKRSYTPPELLPYTAHDRENALRLAAQERFEIMMNGQHNKHHRRKAK